MIRYYYRNKIIKKLWYPVWQNMCGKILNANVCSKSLIFLLQFDIELVTILKEFCLHSIRMNCFDLNRIKVEHINQSYKTKGSMRYISLYQLIHMFISICYIVFSPIQQRLFQGVFVFMNFWFDGNMVNIVSPTLFGRVVWYNTTGANKRTCTYIIPST